MFRVPRFPPSPGLCVVVASGLLSLGCGKGPERPDVATTTAPGGTNTPDATPNGSDPTVVPGTLSKRTPDAVVLSSKAGFVDGAVDLEVTPAPWVGLKAEEQGLLRQLDGMLGGIARKGSAVDTAVTGALKKVREAEDRATLVMRLSRYKLAVTPEAGPKLLAMLGRLREVEPRGSIYRFVGPHFAGQFNERGPFEIGYSECADVLRSQVKRGKAVNKQARDLLASLGKRPEAKRHDRDNRKYPDVTGKIVAETLTVGDLVVYLNDLEAHARSIIAYREMDARLHEVISTFEEIERLRILLRMTEKLRVSWKGHVYPRDEVPTGDKEMQEWLQKMFVGPDRRAVASLAEVLGAREELARFLRAAVPDFDWNFRPLVSVGGDGKPLPKVLGPIAFSFIDPKLFVKSSGRNHDGYYIEHNFDD